jgi:hypothetical protein
MNYAQSRRAENEAIFKQHNMRVKRLAKNILSASKSDISIKFMCECSNEDCRDKIEITITEMETARSSPHDFIIIPGHEQKDIELVKLRRQNYEIVEKFENPPPTNGVLNKT